MSQPATDQTHSTVVRVRLRTQDLGMLLRVYAQKGKHPTSIAQLVRWAITDLADQQIESTGMYISPETAQRELMEVTRLS